MKKIESTSWKLSKSFSLNLKLLIIHFYSLYVCAYMNIWAPCVCRLLQRVRIVSLPGTGVTGGCELPDVGAVEPNSGPLEEQ